MKTSKQSTHDSPSKSTDEEDDSRLSGESTTEKSLHTKKVSRRHTDNPKALAKNAARAAAEKERRRNSEAPKKKVPPVEEEKKKKPRKKNPARRISIDDMDYDLEGLVMRHHESEKEGGASNDSRGKSIEGEKKTHHKKSSEGETEKETSSRGLSDERKRSSSPPQRRRPTGRQRHHSTRIISSSMRPSKPPRRRISIDDMDFDLEGFVMRHSNEKENESSSTKKTSFESSKKESSSSKRLLADKKRSSASPPPLTKRSQSSRRLSSEDEEKSSRQISPPEGNSRSTDRKRSASPPPLKKSQSSRRLSGGKENSSRQQSSDDKEKSSRQEHPLERESRTSSSERPTPARSSRRSRSRRPSIDDIALLGIKKLSRRKSNESKKSKDDSDTERGGKEGTAAKKESFRRKYSDKKKKSSRQNSTERDSNSIDSSEKRKAPRRSRRPTLDDFPVLDFLKERRRQSHKNNAKKKLRDDMHVRRSMSAHMPKEKSSKGKLPAPRRGQMSRHSSDTDLGRVLGRMGSMESVMEAASSQEGDSNNRPKRRSLDEDTPKNKSSGLRRSTHGSNESRDIAFRKSMHVHESDESSVSSCETDEEEKGESSAPIRRYLRHSSESARWEKHETQPKRLSLDETQAMKKSGIFDIEAFEVDDTPEVSEAKTSRKHNTHRSSCIERNSDRHVEKIQRRTGTSSRGRQFAKSMMVKPESRTENSSSFSRGLDYSFSEKVSKKQDSEDANERPSHNKYKSDGDVTKQKRSSERKSLVSSHDGDAVKSKTDSEEETSESDSLLEKKKPKRRKNPRRKSSRRTGPSPNRPKKRKWRCLCCIALLVLLAVAAAVILFILRNFFKKGGEFKLPFPTSLGASEAPTPVSVISTEGDEIESEALSEAPSEAPSPGNYLSTSHTLTFTIDSPSINSPGATPSDVFTDRPAVMSPIPIAPATPASPSTSIPLVTIAVIVQLDAKPEETGFSLVSSDYSTTYASREIGSLAGLHNEVVMEVMDIQEQTELLFELTDASGDGLCCTHGKGYYRVLAGAGTQKKTIISSEQAAKFIFTVGMGHAQQIGGVDPNEYCKPCPDGKDCGRCAWCNADEGFKSEEIYDWQCHSDPVKIPKKCFLGSKRFQLHNRYVTAMAKCTDGFEAWPQMESSPETTVCVEEAKCVKTFAFFEPVCEEELSGSLLVKETCQDKVGGFAFGYSWGLNAPREKECPSARDFAVSLSPRCCEDQVAFCSTFDEEDENEEVSELFQEKTSPTLMPAGTYAPTVSHAPTWDGYPLTLLIQLDDFPRETGFSITSADKKIIYLERRQGYYKKSQLVVEKVQIPEGVEAILTVTDEGGDGICCENGHGYFQLYSDQGSLILDESAIFSNGVNRTFVVGEPETLPPTVSSSPSISLAPSFNVFPITIAVQLDQWSDETGFSIQSIDGSNTFFDWPTGSFSDQSSDLIFETVLLPRDTEVILRVTDEGGDGFCCLYGEGYVKIYAGESAEDESALLAFKSAEFESDLSIIFQAGPAPSAAPATTSSPTAFAGKASSNGSISSGWCDTRDGKLVDDSCAEVTLVMQLDKFSAETSWSIDSNDGGTNFASRPDGYYAEMQSQKIIETVYLPDDGRKYQFKIVDFMGDGTCCWAGNGWYSLYKGRDIEDESSQLFYGQGDFGRERAHLFAAGNRPASTTSPPTHSPQPTVTKYAVEVNIKFDDYSSQTGWYIASVDGTVLVDRPPGYYSGNDTLTVVENVRLEPGEYQFSALDANGDGFCCQHGIGYYLLNFNGGTLLYQQGRFEFSRDETFSIGNLPRTSNAMASSKSAPFLRGSIPSSDEPSRKRKHVDNKK